jgi:hypothetical protein
MSALESTSVLKTIVDKMITDYFARQPHQANVKMIVDVLAKKPREEQLGMMVNMVRDEVGRRLPWEARRDAIVQVLSQHTASPGRIRPLAKRGRTLGNGGG